MLSYYSFGRGMNNQFLLNFYAQNNRDTLINPLISFSNQWGSKIYKDCNTAASENYLTADEKKVIWILNMIRANPILFLQTVLLNPSSKYYKPIAKWNSYDSSLLNTLSSIQPNFKFLVSDLSAYHSAQCHAISSGKTGYVGHQRIHSDCIADYNGECCTYGYTNPLSMVMSFLLDYDVPDLAHRHICLSNSFISAGISIQPHKRYKINTVIDFK